MNLPKYLPKVKLAASRKYKQLVKDYGSPPKGYRWLEFGEEIKSGDLFASGSLLSWGQPLIIAGRVADDSRWPHARPLPKSTAAKSPASSNKVPAPSLNDKIAALNKKVYEMTAETNKVVAEQRQKSEDLKVLLAAAEILNKES